MNFGVTGYGLCSSHIHSNPVTIAAIQRQQEKDRQARILAEIKELQRLEAETARLELERQCAERDRRESRFRIEFLHMIYAQRAFHETNTKKTREVMARHMPLMKDIISEFAIKNGVTYDCLVGELGPRTLSTLRHAAMYEVHIQRPDKSYIEIGAAFGGRNYTTVMNAIGTHTLLNGIDHSLAVFVQRKRLREKATWLNRVIKQTKPRIRTPKQRALQKQTRLVRLLALAA